MQRLIPILVLLGSLTSLTIDMNLPALPSIAEALGVTPAKVQWALSAFLLSFAFGQLVFGPLSDRLGRKPPLVAGGAIFLLGNGLCLYANSVEVLIGAWFLLGLGACAGAVGWISIVRDCFQNGEMTRVTAQISAWVGLGSIIAPIAGAFMTRSFGWRAGHMVLLMLGVALFVWVVCKLPETNPRRDMGRVSLKIDYLSVLQNREFVTYTLINLLAFAGLFSFISNASMILIGGYGVSPGSFGFLFASNATVFVLGGFLTVRLARLWSSSRIVLAGAFAMTLGGLAMAALAGHGDPAMLMLPMYLGTLGAAMILPVSASGAIAPFEQLAGTAASLQGALRFGAGSLASMIVGLFSGASNLPLACSLSLCGSVCLFIVGMMVIHRRKYVLQDGLA